MRIEKSLPKKCAGWRCNCHKPKCKWWGIATGGTNRACYHLKLVPFIAKTHAHIIILCHNHSPKMTYKKFISNPESYIKEAIPITSWVGCIYGRFHHIWSIAAKAIASRGHKRQYSGFIKKGIWYFLCLLVSAQLFSLHSRGPQKGQKRVNSPSNPFWHLYVPNCHVKKGLLLSLFMFQALFTENVMLQQTGLPLNSGSWIMTIPAIVWLCTWFIQFGLNLIWQHQLLTCLWKVIQDTTKHFKTSRKGSRSNISTGQLRILKLGHIRKKSRFNLCTLFFFLKLSPHIDRSNQEINSSRVLSATLTTGTVTALPTQMTDGWTAQNLFNGSSSIPPVRMLLMIQLSSSTYDKMSWSNPTTSRTAWKSRSRRISQKVTLSRSMWCQNYWQTYRWVR
jgi:hypothetical protein